MSNTTVSTTVANPIRTGVQGGAAWVVTEILDSFEIIAMDERQYGAVIVGLAMLFAAIQNATENYLGKAILRTIPPTEAKVVDK